MRRYWLMKSEPSAYSIDDLKRDGSAAWEGVRNYQARNLLRDELKPGDGVLFYASSADPTGVTGIAEVSKPGYPDPTAFKKGHAYFDPKSKKDNPTWYVVDIRFVEKFDHTVTLETLKTAPELSKMVVVQRGSRLSVQPVTEAEWRAVLKLAGSKKA